VVCTCCIGTRHLKKLTSFSDGVYAQLNPESIICSLTTVLLFLWWVTPATDDGITTGCTPILRMVITHSIFELLHHLFAQYLEHFIDVGAFLGAGLQKRHFVLLCKKDTFFRRNDSFCLRQIALVSHNDFGNIVLVVLGDLAHPAGYVVERLAVTYRIDLNRISYVPTQSLKHPCSRSQ